MKLSLLISAAALGLASAGCGARTPTLYPVSGKVFQGDKPASGAVVIFHPRDTSGSTVKPVGTVDDNGDFTLSYDNHFGAPAGEYVVTIHWQYKQNPFAAPQDRLEGRFANPQASQIRASVESAPTVLGAFRVD